MTTPANPPNPLDQFFGFTEMEPKEHRLVISADGLDKRGKTYWALMTTPEPILIVTADTGTQEVIDQARAAGRRVGKMELEFEIGNPKARKESDIDATLAAAWKAEWLRFLQSQYAIINDKSRTIRTLVWDTGSDIKNLLELAHFGKTKGNIRQDLRTDMNAEFHKLFWDLYKKRPDLNIIIIHRNKKQYEKKAAAPGKEAVAEWTGAYERDGHTKIGYYVDVVLTFEWDAARKDFYTIIRPENPCRFMQNATNFVDKRFYAKPATILGEKESHFAVLGETLFPETEGTGVWEK